MTRKLPLKAGSNIYRPVPSNTDNYHGDITADIVTVNNVDTSVVGSYTVTYNVTHVSRYSIATEVTRTVSVTDHTAPVWTLVGDTQITVEVGCNIMDRRSYFRPSDNYDGDITAHIVSLNNVAKSVFVHVFLHFSD